MQLDIAVESVLTANGAMHALLRRLIGAPTRWSATAPASTPRRSRAACWTSRPTSDSARSAQGCTAPTRTRPPGTTCPGAVLLALGTDGGRGLEASPREAGGELHLAMDNCPHQAVLVGEPAAIDRAREAAAREGIVCRGAALRPRCAHAAVRPLRRGPAQRLRGATGRPGAHTAVVVHHRGSLPGRPGSDPRAAGRALDQPGSLPRDDRGALRGRCARVRGGRSARQHDLVHRGHPARPSLLRGGLRRAPPLRASPS